jgi:hypothetical protein
MPAEPGGPSYLAREPDEKELRAREREMHEAQMREEARQREAQPQPERQTPERVMPASQPAVARVDPREVLESAGLQMVETRPERVSAAPPEPEGVPLGRPRRERPRRVAEDEPLVQVETKN